MSLSTKTRPILKESQIINLYKKINSRFIIKKIFTILYKKEIICPKKINNHKNFDTYLKNNSISYISLIKSFSNSKKNTQKRYYKNLTIINNSTAFSIHKKKSNEINSIVPYGTIENNTKDYINKIEFMINKKVAKTTESFISKKKNSKIFLYSHLKEKTIDKKIDILFSKLKHTSYSSTSRYKNNNYSSTEILVPKVKELLLKIYQNNSQIVTKVETPKSSNITNYNTHNITIDFISLVLFINTLFIFKKKLLLFSLKNFLW